MDNQSSEPAEEPSPAPEPEAPSEGPKEGLDVPDSDEVPAAGAENVSHEEEEEEEEEEENVEEEKEEAPDAPEEAGDDVDALDVDLLIEQGMFPEGDTRDDEDDDGTEKDGAAASEPEQGRAERQPNLELDSEELLQALQTERDELIQRNEQLQAKVFNTFLAAGDRWCSEAESEEEQERNYQVVTEALQCQLQLEEQFQDQQVDKLRRQSRQMLEKAEHEWRTLVATKCEAATTALTCIKGGVAGRAEARRLGNAEQKCQDELVAIRLENVSLMMEMLNLESLLKTRTKLTDNIQLIDFEHLKIESQENSEKNEEVKEKLLKQKKKLSHTVQIQSHVKEKLHSVQMENTAKRERLCEVAEAALREEEVLSRTKLARDALRSHGLRLQQRCGMLGNPALLRDLEETEDEREALESRLETLRRRHTTLTLRCRGVRKNLEQSAMLLC